MSELSPIPVLLGGSGYIGSALARQLVSRGERPRIADVQPSAAMPHAWVRTDVRDPDAVVAALNDAETLFLLAAEHGLEPRPYVRFEETNVGGARTVVAAARRTGLRRIIFTSTVNVYGMPGTAVTEESPCRPTDPYGRTKLAAEGILRAWAAEDAERTLVIIRPTVVFGPGVRGRMRALFHKFAEPGFCLIGNGRNRKSFAQGENLAAFHAYARVLGPGTHLFNYSDGPDLSMAELASLIRSTLGLAAPVASRHPAGALLWAAARQFAATIGGPEPEWTISRIRRFLADSRFLATRVAATGFVAPHTLVDAIAAYARSDLRWTAGRVTLDRTFSPVPAGDVPIT